MVTILYAALGTAVIVGCWLVIVGATLELDDWARSAWARLRWSSRPFEAPPVPPGRRAIAAGFAWILALFLGALVLPR